MNNETRIRELYDAACRVRLTSYSPYSGFAVGAAVETGDGEVFLGCNVENGAYPLSLCAEQVAIARAVSEEHREFRRIVVVAHPLATPCGACRQVISEFFPADGVVLSIDAENFEDQRQWSMEELLPDRFRLDPGDRK